MMRRIWMPFGVVLLFFVGLATSMTVRPQAEAKAVEENLLVVEENSALMVERLRTEYAPVDVVASPLQDLICYMGYRGILTCEQQKFNPEQPISRGMVAVTLYRMSGGAGEAPLANGTFTDVPSDT